MNLQQLLFGLTALVVAAGVTPVVMLVMKRLGIVDRPDGERKLHRHSVPLGGGIAIWLALVIAVGSFTLFGNRAWLPSLDSDWSSLFVACTLLCVVGLADDAWNLRGRQKLLGQLIAVSVLLADGLVIRALSLFGWHIELGVLSVPFTLFWILGAVNAINLLDGTDGLAATVGALIGYALAVLAIMQGLAGEGLIALALASGTLGFLIYNFPPARVFLGESGSTLIGLVLGVLAIRVSLKSPGTVALAVPITIWTLPILDISMAILRRRLTGRSIYLGDRAHLHHRLSERGLGPLASLLLVGSLCTVTMIGALASVALKREWIAPLAALAVVSFLALTRLFGHSELLLLARRARSFVQSLLPFRQTGAREHRSQIQGTFQWDRFWESLVSFAEQHHLDHIELSVHVPSMHEHFFACWNREGQSERAQNYRAEVPLTSPPFGTIGSLRIAGCRGPDSACAWIGDLVKGLRPFELQMGGLITAGLGRRAGKELILVQRDRSKPSEVDQHTTPLAPALATDTSQESALRRTPGDSAA